MLKFAMLLLTFLVRISLAQPAFVSFPKSFRWCAATSSYQVEGGNSNSDWWHFEQQPGRIKNGDRSGEASGHWTHLKEDIALMKKMGLNEYRMSVEWARVETSPGQLDAGAIAHYRDEVKALLAAGIRPIITLQHFTLPYWVQEKGGWEWKGLPTAFGHYAEVVYDQIGPEVRDWVSINEPVIEIMAGYYEGNFSPGKKVGLWELRELFHSVVRAHNQAYWSLHGLAGRKKVPVRVGLASALSPMDPASWSPLDRVAAGLADYLWNWAFPAMIRTHQDFFGINYYTGQLVHVSLTEGLQLLHRPGLSRNDMGWDIYPEGLARVINEVRERYPGLPILITENGIADASDRQRVQYMRGHLEVVSKAITDGAPIENYCHWSLLDNFEWAEGFGPRFGLIEVDYATLRRKPRPSAEFYRKVIENSGFLKK